jgi:MarR family transcriptional regulator, organic hydroperoxide resistance regulator
MRAKSARRTAKPAASSAAVDGDRYVARAMDSLRRIVHSLRVATRASERSFGLSAAQHFVLRQLALEPGQSLIDLAHRTRTTQSSVSEVVSRLVKRELVSRRTSDTDRRRTELSLTPAGDAVLKRSPETVQEKLVAGFATLGETERRRIADGLEEWLAASSLGDVEPILFFEEPDA